MSTSIRARSVGLATAAVLVVLGWAGISPRPASAQLGGLLGSLIVAMTAPSSGSTVGGATTVSANVSIVGALTVAGVQFKLDGVNLGAEDRSAPYSMSWDTLTAANGSHTLTAVARDLLGLRYTSTPVTVTVFNDKTPPVVTITSPPDGRAVGSAIWITADATDNVGVVGVQFFVDGAPRGTEDTTAPYVIDWNSKSVANGPHTLTATARDAAGNTASSAVTVMVENDVTPPTVTMTSPADGATVSGIISVRATAWDSTRVGTGSFHLDGVRVPPFLNSQPFGWTWDTTTVANGSHTVRVATGDISGNPASAEVTVTVANDTTDTTPPAAAITSPGSGDTVSDIVSITADASDNVVAVRFFVDGATPVGQDTTAPYTANWETRTHRNGTYSLTAVVRDQAGNITTSDPVVLTVANTPDLPDTPDTTPPAVAITSPAAPATLAGIATVAASASDNHIVRGVLFLVDGVRIGEEDTTAPYEIAWDTAAWTDEPHVLTAVAHDMTGNSSWSESVTVTTANGTAVTRVEEADAAITYSGTWAHESGNSRLSGDGAALAYVVGQRATFSFTGTGVSWIGYRGPQAGLCDVILDGERLEGLDTYAPMETFQVELYKQVGLAPGPHMLEIVVVGRSSLSTDRLIVIDAFEVIQPGGSPDTTPPAVAIGSPASGATVSGTQTVTASASDDVGVAGVQFFLNSTALGAEDTTSPYAVTWDTTTVADGSYMLTALARDSSGNWTTSAPVNLTVANGPGGGTVARIEETSAVYTPEETWSLGNTDRPWSGDTAAMGGLAGQQATFTFSGAGVSWIGFRGPQAGIADVYLDGIKVATVDAYASDETVGAVLYAVTGLEPRTHTLTIEVTGTRHPLSSDNFVVVDAFDVLSDRR